MPAILARLRTLFLKPRPAVAIGARLYAACVTQSRNPVFYTEYGVEDAIGARFEMLCLHVGAVVLTLRAVPAEDPRHGQAHETGQALFDAFLGALDNTLREQGVGDLKVPKTMKKLGVVVYTRMKRWEDMWRDNAGIETQAAYAARTVFAGSELGEAADEDSGTDGNDDSAKDVTPAITAFATYMNETRQTLEAGALMAGEAHWAHIPMFDTPAAMEA